MVRPKGVPDMRTHKSIENSLFVVSLNLMMKERIIKDRENTEGMPLPSRAEWLNAQPRHGRPGKWNFE